MTNHDFAFNDDYAGDTGRVPAFDRAGGVAKAGRRVMENAFYISLDRISARKQVREDFDSTHIDELALSLSQHGLISPIEVKEEGDGYVIVAGECRFRAAKLIGWTEIACVVTDAQNTVLRQITENTHRKDLNPVEEARAYQMAIDELGLDGKSLAEKMGVSASKITRSLRILSLPADILAKVASGAIPKSVIREVQKVRDENRQRELIAQYEQGGSYGEIEKKAGKQRVASPPTRGVKKTAVIDEINFTVSSRKKKTLAEIAAAARTFADQIEASSRSRAA